MTRSRDAQAKARTMFTIFVQQHMAWPADQPRQSVEAFDVAQGIADRFWPELNQAMQEQR